MELAHVDHGYTGEKAAEEAAGHGIRLKVAKHKEARRVFALLSDILSVPPSITLAGDTYILYR